MTPIVRSRSVFTAEDGFTLDSNYDCLTATTVLFVLQEAN